MPSLFFLFNYDNTEIARVLNFEMYVEVNLNVFDLYDTTIITSTDHRYLERAHFTEDTIIR